MKPDLDPAAAAAPLDRLAALPPAPPLGRRPRFADEAPGARALTHGLMRAVAGDPDLKVLAVAGFAGHVRAYATHPPSSRAIFHPRSLHLGHLASAFGLRDPPSVFGKSSPAGGKDGGRGEKRGGGGGEGGRAGRRPPPGEAGAALRWRKQHCYTSLFPKMTRPHQQQQRPPPAPPAPGRAAPAAGAAPPARARARPPAAPAA